MSLRFKILAAVVVVMLAVMTLLVINITVDARRRAEREQELRRQWVMQLIQTSLEGRYQVQNKDEVRELIVPLERGELVAGWALVDTAGTVEEKHGRIELAEVDPRLVQAALSHGTIETSGHHVVVPIILMGVSRRWGTAQLMIRIPAPMNYAAQEVSQLVFWMLCLGTLALLVVLYVLLARTVLRPIERLARAAERLSAGQYRFDLEVPDREDEIGQLVGAFRHMKERLANYHSELEREIAAARETIEKQARGLLVAQRLAATGTLAAGIAHEVNNPLGGMLNAALSLKKRHALDARTVEYLDLVIEGLGRVKDTVAKVLQFTPRREVALGPVRLAQVIDAAVGLVRYRVERAGIALERRVAEDLPEVQGNASELQQVFVNLLLNALDALDGRPGGRIEIEARSAAGLVRVDVRDTGCGMEEEQISKAFDLFYTTKEPGKGTGLGLSIVHDIVTRHKGQVEIESAKGEGTTIHIALPA